MTQQTDKLELNAAFVLDYVQKSRAIQRATDFLRISARSILLRGWSAASVCEMLTSGSRKPFEVIIPPSIQKIEKAEGDIVAPSSVFTSSKNIAWDGDVISLYTDGGMLLNIDEFEYVQSHGLNTYQFFAAVEKKDGDVETLWKALSRRSAEARKDKATNILYLTFGTLSWETDDRDTQGRRIRVNSPLFLVPIKEDLKSKASPKFQLISQKMMFNPILARMLKTHRSVELYAGCGKLEIEFADYANSIERIRDNVSEMPDAYIKENDMHVCILDSSNEIMCQAAERNINKIIRNELTSVFAKTADYVPRHITNGDTALFPLPADDSQREVVSRVVAGDSVNVVAAPGTGKSATAVNCVANLLIRGKTVCVMSEKKAANEVFVDYCKRCGLDIYCLVLDEPSVKEVVSQIKRILANTKVFVDAEEARAVIAKYTDVVAEFDKLNEVYNLIPELGTNLYHVIGEGLGAEDLGCAFNIKFEDYRAIMQTLSGFQSQYLDTMSDAEWSDYLESGTTGDEELDEMLGEILSKFETLGVAMLELVRSKGIAKDVIGSTIRAQIARFVAEAYITSLDLKGYGNKKLKMLYKKLIEAAAQMQNVSGAFVQQELGRRIAEAAKGGCSRFIELLDRLATSNIGLQDFFTTYGADVVKLCPVIVSTPGVLVNYEKLNCFQTLIIDESSQMPFTNTLPFLIDNRQLVIFGDPLQLDITSRYAKADIYETGTGEDFDLSQTDKSILHVAQGKIPGCQLQYHYRSKTEHLLTVSNARCYDSLLNVAPDIYLNKDALPDSLGYEIIQIDNPEIAQSGANLSETREIVRRVAEIKAETPEKVIGIVTFNEQQQNSVYDEIERISEEDPDIGDVLSSSGDSVWVRTLENAQGKEADVICVCIGHARRNKDGSINKGISEIYKEGGLNRLNVLFTRAREKVIVSISFNYKELRSSDNKGVYRLYEYLHYAATGECEGITDRTIQPDKYNATIVERVSKLLPEFDAYGRVGRDNMMVDIGMTHNGGQVYEVGLLLPGKALSANTLYTKACVLERSGWKLLPLSPISCFTRPDLFATQLKREIEEPVVFSCKQAETYTTDTLPPSPLTLDDFKAGERLKTRITEDQLLKEDIDSAYGRVWQTDVQRADDAKLNKLAKKGNLQARLRLIILRLPQFIKGGQIDAVIAAAQKGYELDNLYCYLYAQLLRVRADVSDEALIDELLSEANRMGIKVA